MTTFLLLAGLSLHPVDLDEPIVDVRVADIDADGKEDVVAVSKEYLFLLKGGKGPAIRRKAPPLTVVGRGLFGVVREGRYRPVADPFGAWKEGDAGVVSYLAWLGRGAPALLRSPGDLDGDGKDDPVLSGPDGFRAPGWQVPVIPEAQLDIYRNEAFAVEYRIPLPVVGNWSGGSRKELVFNHDGAVVAYHRSRETDRIPLPLVAGKEAGGLRRHQVFLRDANADGRLDLLVVAAKGKTELFSKFEATARFWPGGRVYDRTRKGFFRPLSILKVSGVLLKPTLLDIDSDRDLDLVLSTIDVSLVAMVAGTAPGTYYLFRFGDKGYQRKPAWTFKGPVPLSAFTAKPEPPVRFLPDLDGDGRPEALEVGPELRLHEAKTGGGFREQASTKVEAPGRPSIGRRLAAIPHKRGVIVVEGK